MNDGIRKTHLRIRYTMSRQNYRSQVIKINVELLSMMK